MGRGRERVLLGIGAHYALLLVIIAAYSVGRSGTPNNVGIQEVVGLVVLATASVSVRLLVKCQLSP